MGNCLNLIEAENLDLVRDAHEQLKQVVEAQGDTMPENTGHGLRARRLDCAVFEILHQYREQESLPQFDTLRAFFVEGEPITRPPASANSTTSESACAIRPASSATSCRETSDPKPSPSGSRCPQRESTHPARSAPFHWHAAWKWALRASVTIHVEDSVSHPAATARLTCLRRPRFTPPLHSTGRPYENDHRTERRLLFSSRPANGVRATRPRRTSSAASESSTARRNWPRSSAATTPAPAARSANSRTAACSPATFDGVERDHFFPGVNRHSDRWPDSRQG